MSRNAIQNLKDFIVFFQLGFANPANTLRTAIVKAYEAATDKTKV
jgi:hypothetical protein